MQEFFVYILRCSDNTLYTGWTTDIGKRVEAHNAGKGAKYTRARLPVKCIFSESFSKKELAMKREYEIKQLSRLEKARLIQGGGSRLYANPADICSAVPP